MPYKNKVDQLAAQRRHYVRHKDKYLISFAARRAKHREWLNQYKQQHPCVCCGESDISCLDFHHLDPTTKELKGDVAFYKNWAISHVEQEIAKCVVLCSNCHRKLHAGREISRGL